jgi:HK97 family phage major capsid protein
MDLQTLQTRQSKIVHDAEALLALADRETRALTADEEKTYDGHVKSLEDVGKQIAKFKGDTDFMSQLDALTGEAARDGGRVIINRVGGRKSVGQLIIESEIGKWLTETKATRSGRWQSPAVEIKATLTEDPASGGDLVVPHFLPGIIPSATAPVRMSELFAPGTTESNAVTYMEETLYTNAADTVLEGAAKPESTLTFNAVTNPLRKIAHWLPASDEILEDVPTLRSYLDARLRLGVLLALDDQLLNGSGVAPDLNGLLVRTDLAPALPVGTMTGPDAIAAQIAAIEAASGMLVDAIVLNPSDATKFLLLKTSTGEYIGPGPFSSPQAPTMWGRAVATTPKIPQGTALVGAFKTGGGQLFRRGGIRVDISNSHQDFFVKNLVAIRAEIRVALALYRPGAFGKITGLNPVTP